MAGAEGIEPPSTVLETVVVPFNYTPMESLKYYKDFATLLTSPMSTFPEKFALKCFMMDGKD